MANYLLGLGGKCCADCTANNPCKARPVVGGNGLTPCTGEAISLSGFWGSNTPTSRTITGLPTGLSYNTGTNILSGTPTSAGTTVCTATATNACGTKTDAGTVTITVSTRPAITSALAAGGVPGTAFTYTITSVGSPTSYSATPLPAGLSIDTGTGVISGTPTTGGTTNVTITANDGNPCPARAVLVITIGCNWSGVTTSPTCGFDTTYDVTGLFLADLDITVTLTGGQCYPDGGPYVCTDSASRVKVWANSVLIFDTGCITGNGSWPVTVPSGTTSLRCYSECECDFVCESGCGTTSAVSFLCPL